MWRGFYEHEGKTRVYISPYAELTYVRRVLKNGKFGKRFDCVWYTPLRNCELCEVLGTRKKVHWRTGVYGWDTNLNDKPESENARKAVLCMGCWNKVKPIAKAKKEALEIRYLTNKLYKEVLKCQKSQTLES
jgi:hypothetical protein